MTLRSTIITNLIELSTQNVGKPNIVTTFGQNTFKYKIYTSVGGKSNNVNTGSTNVKYV